MPYKSYARKLQYQRERDRKYRKALRARARKLYKLNQKQRNLWQRAYNQRRNAELRHEVLAGLGNKCIQCGFSDWRALHVDHIKGNGKLDRKKYPGTQRYARHILRHIKRGNKKYQILCANCNWIKMHEQHEVANQTGI